jgi:hypothetical protein
MNMATGPSSRVTVAVISVPHIDPHGDIASDLVSAIPPFRSREIIYFDPADLDFPIGLNVLESVDPDWHFLVADQLIAVFRNIWKDSWGPRLEYFFYNAVLSLLHVQGSTLLSVPRLFTDKHYRAWITSQLDDPLLKRFWAYEYEPLTQALQREATLPVLNKCGQFLMAPALRHIVGQRRPKLNPGEVMDDSRIFIANLSKGRIGEHNSMLVGSLLLTKFFLEALRRADRPEDERVDYSIIADELHNLASGDMLATILSEARKYRLSITGAFQYLNSLNPNIRSAIFGNVGTLLAFRCGSEDSGKLEAEFAPYCRAADLQTLGRHEFYIRLAADGITTRPFPAVSLPPVTLAYRPQDRERIIRSSRERYGVRRKEIEQKISRWLSHTPGSRPDAPGAGQKSFVVT